MAWTCIDCGTAYPARVVWCAHCGAQGRVVLLGRRPGAEIDSAPEAATAESLAILAAAPRPVAAYPAILSGHGALVVLWGPPGGGKSTMAARWLDGIRGPVLFVSCEEGLGPTLAARLARLGIARPTFHLLGRATVDQVAQEIGRTRAVAVAIDSVQAAAWEPAELRHLLALSPRVETLMAVCQVNAKGLPEGRRALTHEADVAVNVEAMTARLTKSRYQEISDDDRENGMSVLFRDGARDPIRQARAPVLHLRSVQRPHLPEGNAVPGEPRDPLAAGERDGREDRDGSGGVGARPGDEDPGRGVAPADHAN